MKNETKNDEKLVRKNKLREIVPALREAELSQFLSVSNLHSKGASFPRFINDDGNSKFTNLYLNLNNLPTENLIRLFNDFQTIGGLRYNSSDETDLDTLICGFTARNVVGTISKYIIQRLMNCIEISFRKSNSNFFKIDSQKEISDKLLNPMWNPYPRGFEFTQYEHDILDLLKNDQYSLGNEELACFGWKNKNQNKALMIILPEKKSSFIHAFGDYTGIETLIQFYCSSMRSKHDEYLYELFPKLEFGENVLNKLFSEKEIKDIKPFFKIIFDKKMKYIDYFD